MKNHTLPLESIYLIILISFFSGCKSTNSLNNSAMLTANEWELTHMMGDDIRADVFSEKLPMISFTDGGEFAGYTGCNNLRGTYNLEGNTLTLNPGPMTRKACPGDGEQRVLNALTDVNAYSFNGDELLLMNGSIVVLRYIKM